MKNLTIYPEVSIKDALKQLTKFGEKCLIVMNHDNKLIGTLSDGDLRRAILKGVDVKSNIEKIFNPKPTFLVMGKYSKAEAKSIFLRGKFDLIPIIDHDGTAVDFITWDKIFKSDENRTKQILNVPVVIMAGGKGTRLEPFSKVLPKPLLPIHEKPIIEHIIEKFVAAGVQEFHLTVNYKSRILKAFFEELNPDYSMSFVEEQDPLGTAGSLKLLEGKFDQSFLVTNCDIIIDMDYSDLYTFHQKKDYDITLVASMKNYVIPYGTCELNSKGHLSHIKEKPEYNFLVNTGLYVLKPDMLKIIPGNKMYHMNDLIEDIKKKGLTVGVYPIDDDAWVDVGQWAEYKKVVERFRI